MRYLAHLFENNRRWAADRTHNDPAYFHRLSSGQSPNYLWIGCSDSRVPANQIVGLNPGELFVHRNVANLVPQDDPNSHAVIHFAVHTLRVQHIIVCGHDDCGGVQTALGPTADPPLEKWVHPIRTLAQKHQDELDALPDIHARARRLAELNVIAQVQALANLPTLQNAWKDNHPLTVHGWVLDLPHGLLRDLDVSVNHAPGA